MLVRILFSWLLILLLAAPIVKADIINVPDDFETIQGAIDESEDGDTVLVQPGEYVENIDFDGKDITVASLFLIEEDENLIDETIIDGDQNGCVVTLANRETDQAILAGFTIRNGTGFEMVQDVWHYFYGGGIYCSGSSPVIRNCKIIDNRQPVGEFNNGCGGGVSCRGADPVIENCVVGNNSALNKGGGIYGDDYSHPTVVGCTIEDNSIGGGEGGVMAGGGIYGSSFIVSDCIITGNEAIVRGGEGGGIFGAGDTVTGSIISGNRATAGGGLFLQLNNSITNCTITENSCGGVFCWNSDAEFADCIITDNYSDDRIYTGGGIKIFNPSPLTGDSPTFSRCVISDNSAGEHGDGGGIYCWWEAAPRFDYCLFSGNYPEAIYCRTGTIILSNCTLADNPPYPYYGPAIISGGRSLTVSNSILWNPAEVISISRETELVVLYSCIHGGRDGIIDYGGEVNWGEGNIDENPLFADPDSDDYHLSVYSPCIDAGDPDSELDPDSTRADMGALYFHQPDFVRESGESLPQSFGIIAAYPNPFNRTTVVQYQTTGYGFADLVVFDFTGRQVQRLFLGHVKPGLHSLIWDAADLSAGMYVVRLVDGRGMVQSVKLTLVN